MQFVRLFILSAQRLLLGNGGAINLQKFTSVVFAGSLGLSLWPVLHICHFHVIDLTFMILVGLI